MSTSAGSSATTPPRPRTEAVMRGTILGGAVLGIVVLTAAPALACSTLTPRACAASGGSFTHHGQVSTLHGHDHGTADDGALRDAGHAIGGAVHRRVHRPGAGNPRCHDHHD